MTEEVGSINDNLGALLQHYLDEIFRGKPFEIDAWSGEPIIIGFNEFVANNAIISHNDTYMLWNEALSEVFSGDEFDDRTPEEIFDLYQNGRLKMMIGKNDEGKVEVLSVLGSVEAFDKENISEILKTLGYPKKEIKKRLSANNIPVTKLREIVMAYTPQVHAGNGYNNKLLEHFSKDLDSHYAVTASPQMMINAFKEGYTILSFKKTPLVSILLGFGQTKGGGTKYVPVENIGWLSETDRKALKGDIYHNNTRKDLAKNKKKRALIMPQHPLILVPYDLKSWHKHLGLQEYYREEYERMKSLFVNEEWKSIFFNDPEILESLNNDPKKIRRYLEKMLRNGIIAKLRKNYDTIPISSKISEIEPFLQQTIFESPRFKKQLRNKGIRAKSIQDTEVVELMTTEFINVMSEISHKRLNASTGKPIDP